MSGYLWHSTQVHVTIISPLDSSQVPSGPHAYSTPSSLSPAIFSPPARWNTLLKKRSQILPSPVEMLQRLPMDGVPAPALDLKARSVCHWSPKHHLHLPLTHYALLHKLPFLSLNRSSPFPPQEFLKCYLLWEGVSPHSNLIFQVST